MKRGLSSNIRWGKKKFIGTSIFHMKRTENLVNSYWCNFNCNEKNSSIDKSEDVEHICEKGTFSYKPNVVILTQK